MGATCKPPPVARVNFTGEFFHGGDIWDTRGTLTAASTVALHGPVWPLPDKYALATDERTT